MDIKCPHCGKRIDLVGAKELKDDFDLGPNAVTHARERKRFPAPWIEFGNRHVYLRSDIERYVEDRSRATVEATVGQLTAALENLPPAERTKAKKMLERQLKS